MPLLSRWLDSFKICGDCPSVTLSRCLLIWFCLVLHAPLSMLALEGRVRTLAGREYRGVIGWEGQHLKIINLRRGLISHVDLADLWSLSLDPLDRDRTAEEILEDSPELNGGFPLPWESGSMGRVPETVSVAYRDGAFRMESRSCLLGPKDEASPFVFQRARGNRELVARISRASATHAQARAGLMFRTDLASGAPSIFWGTTVSDGDLCEWRTASNAPVESSSAPPLSGYRWFKLKREGDTFSAYRSRDGFRWMLVCQTNVVLPADLLVGFAAAGATEFRTHTAVFERAQQARRLRSAYPVHVDLASGSSIEAADLEFDSDGFRFSGAQPRPIVRREQVARIIFQPIPGRLEGRLRIGQPGVLLTSGEFLEGEPRYLLDGTLLLDSVLLGQRRLDAFNQVIGVVFRPANPQPTSIEIHMIEGSIWRATQFEVVGHWLQIQEPLLGECRLPLSEIVSLDRDGR